MTRRRSLLPFAALVLAIGAVIALTHDGGSWPGGPRVTAARLRRSLERSGLSIHWRRGRTGDGVSAVVAGVASRGGQGKVGFEFAVAAGNHAEGGMLGRAGFPTHVEAPDKSCRRNPCHSQQPFWVPDDRGVVGNIAYRAYHRVQASPTGDDRLTTDMLDDALFATFRRDDPRAYPVLAHP